VSLEVTLPGATALFTTRAGGVSQGPYATLNVGLWTDDDPDAIAENRRRVAEMAGGRAFAQGHQVHGSAVYTVTTQPPPEAGPSLVGYTDRSRPGSDYVDADGQATALEGVAPIVLVADCLPIAIAGEGAVAMVHAGWRGLAEGVVDAGVAAIRELTPSGPLSAAVGPGAGPCCYEVDDALRGRFAGFGKGRNLDLKAIAREQLAAAGVGAVEDLGLCTICDERFFSHRRDGGITGRQAGVVWRS
jgi:YfiH family protein